MGHTILGLGFLRCKFRKRFAILGAGCDLRFEARRGGIASCEHGL